MIEYITADFKNQQLIVNARAALTGTILGGYIQTLLKLLVVVHILHGYTGLAMQLRNLYLTQYIANHFEYLFELIIYTTWLLFVIGY